MLRDERLIDLLEYLKTEYVHWQVGITNHPGPEEPTIEIAFQRAGQHNFDCDDVRFVNMLLRNRLIINAFSLYYAKAANVTYVDLRLGPIPLDVLLRLN